MPDRTWGSAGQRSTSSFAGSETSSLMALGRPAGDEGARACQVGGAREHVADLARVEVVVAIAWCDDAELPSQREEETATAQQGAEQPGRGHLEHREIDDHALAAAADRLEDLAFHPPAEETSSGAASRDHRRRVVEGARIDHGAPRRSPDGEFIAWSQRNEELRSSALSWARASASRTAVAWRIARASRRWWSPAALSSARRRGRSVEVVVRDDSGGRSGIRVLSTSAPPDAPQGAPQHSHHNVPRSSRARRRARSARPS